VEKLKRKLTSLSKLESMKQKKRGLWK